MCHGRIGDTCLEGHVELLDENIELSGAKGLSVHFVTLKNNN